MSTFEGTPVSEYEVVLPRIAVQAEEAYKKDTVLRLAVEVHIRKVAFDETKDGTLKRVHHFTIDDVQVASTFNPADAVLEEGDATTSKQQTPEEAEEIGITVGRSSDFWPDGARVVGE